MYSRTADILLLRSTLSYFLPVSECLYEVTCFLAYPHRFSKREHWLLLWTNICRVQNSPKHPLIAVKHPQWQYSSLVYQLFSNLSSSTFGSEALFNLDLLAGQPLCEAWHRHSVCTAQLSTVQVFDAAWASVEEVMPYQSSATENEVFFLEDSILFWYLIFTGQ